MLDIKYLRQNLEAVRRKMNERGQNIEFDRFIGLDAKRRDILQAVETLRNERNSVSRQVGELKKKKEDASALIAKMGDVSAKIKEYDETLRVTEEELNAFVMIVPNVQHESVPQGGSSEDNAVVRTWGEKPSFCFAPKQHFELGESLNILDFGRGAKITGARFTLYRGAGAQLERAITNFMLDLHTANHGYTEVFTPFMVNAESMTGTGQLPKFKEDLFKIEGMDYYLIPTAEVPVTNIYRDEILEEDKLPVYLVAYSACFRAEAGSYGKDTRGLIRQHQFNKVEMVKFTTPESSFAELEKLRGDAEDVLQSLGLHYRVLQLAAGDTSFAAAKCYDLEVWAPGMDRYLEVSSCSCFTDFQARRANIRYRDGKGEVRFVHTLNASGLACPRAWIAVVEQCQQADGSILIPAPLRPYMGGAERIPSA